MSVVRQVQVQVTELLAQGPILYTDPHLSAPVSKISQGYEASGPGLEGMCHWLMRAPGSIAGREPVGKRDRRWGPEHGGQDVTWSKAWMSWEVGWWAEGNSRPWRTRSAKA